MRGSRTVFIWLCAITTLTAGACSRKGVGTSDHIKLAFVTNNAANFWATAHKGCDKAAKDLGNVDVDFRIPSDGSAAEQRRIVDDLMANGIAGIAISPVDPANQTAMINEAIAKHVVVLTQDSDAPLSERVCYLGTNNLAAGRQAGQMLKEALPNGGTIMVFVGKRDAINARDRLQGINDELQGSKIKIIDVRTDDTDTVRAKANAADTLVKYPDIAGMVGLWSYNGPAILSAVKDAGKVGKVKIVCFDDEEDILNGIKDGSVYGTVVQQPFEFGYQSVEMMAKYISGDHSVIPPDKMKIVPTLVIKRDNIDDYRAKLNKLKASA